MAALSRTLEIEVDVAYGPCMGRCRTYILGCRLEVLGDRQSVFLEVG